MTLTQTSTLTKKLVIAGMITAVIGTAGGISYSIWHQSYLASLPKPEEKPEEKFGVLPALQFPASEVSSTNYTYSIDTTSGDLPEVSKLMKVYFIPRAGVSLLAPEKSQKLANQLGFDNSPEKPSPTEHRYTNDSGDRLDIDLITGNFHYQKAEASASALLNNPPLPEEEAIKDFKDYLASSNLLPEDIAGSQGKIILNNFPGTQIKNATVSLWPADIDGTPIITATFNEGLIKALIAGAKNPVDMFLRIDYTYWPVDKTTFSTYPLKTTEQAFDDLKAGQSFISQEPLNPQVSIASVHLAYYESEEYIPYLQPVFVFEGPHFQALIPAISQNTNAK